MIYNKVAMEHDKKIALVAHDNKKQDLVDWAKFNRDLLAHHELYATGTTGEILERVLGMPINRLHSGPLGGDQQIGARIVDGLVDFLIFFWDPLEPQPHDPDVKALLRMAVVWNIPIACNRSSADFMISSPLMDGEYDRLVPDYTDYRKHRLPLAEAPGEPAITEDEQDTAGWGEPDEPASAEVDQGTAGWGEPDEPASAEVEQETPGWADPDEPAD